MIRMLVAGTSALVFSTSVAWAECSPETWQDCAGKPWVDGDKMETPIGTPWWPNAQWGADDEAGSTNWYTQPEVILRALAEADKGTVFKLGHEYNSEMPFFGPRQFVMRIPGTPSGGPFGASKTVYHDEFIATEIGQVGTQFDGLGHIGVQIGVDGDRSQMRWYNGHIEGEFATANGLTKLGVEKLHPIVARGILLDFAGLRGVDSMARGECASMDDVTAALDKQGMAGFQFMEGDAILFRYGWESHWDDADTFNSGQPGICMDVARWVAEEVKAGVTGGDTWAATDPVPYPGEPGCAFCIHQFLQTRHGIVNQENLTLKQLADAGVYTFTYMYSPMPITGATGSAGAPIAID
jgi:kynurenine formamidase